jgi:hypothetical protein
MLAWLGKVRGTGLIALSKSVPDLAIASILGVAAKKAP